MNQLYTDIFTEAEDALWHIAEAWQPLASLVLIGNRIKFGDPGDNKRPAVKDSLQTRDLPLLALTPAGFTNDPKRSTNTKFISQKYAWSVYTGDERMRGPGGVGASAGVNAVKFELIRAHERFGNKLPGLEVFNHLVLITDGADQLTDAKAENRHANGWDAVLNVQVDFHLDRAEALIST